MCDALITMTQPTDNARRAPLAVLLAAFALAGCASLVGEDSKVMSARPAPPASPALAIVADAPTGQSAAIDDPSLGGAVQLAVLSTYTAASGRKCKRVSIRPAGGGFATERVACVSQSGWYWTAASIT